MVSGFAVGRPKSSSPTNSRSNDEKFASARQLAAARAQAVADYLDRHGMAQERIGVSSIGAARSPDSSDNLERLYGVGGCADHVRRPSDDAEGD